MPVLRALSCAITAVNSNVLFREVAGPEAGSTTAFAADGKLDETFACIQLGFQIVFVELRRQARPAHGDALHINVDLGRIEGGSGITGGAQDSAPVRIGAADCRLY